MHTFRSSSRVEPEPPYWAPEEYPKFSRVIFTQAVWGPSSESAEGKPTQTVSRNDFPGLEITLKHGMTCMSWPVDEQDRYHYAGTKRIECYTTIPIQRLDPVR